jgi:hypothetical protein
VTGTKKGLQIWKKCNRKIVAAWQKYHRVQHALAHAVSTLLVLLARAFGCRHIFIEWLVTLRGKRAAVGISTGGCPRWCGVYSSGY